MVSKLKSDHFNYILKYNVGHKMLESSCHQHSKLISNPFTDTPISQFLSFANFIINQSTRTKAIHKTCCYPTIVSLTNLIYYQQILTNNQRSRTYLLLVRSTSYIVALLCKITKLKLQKQKGVYSSNFLVTTEGKR